MIDNAIFLALLLTIFACNCAVPHTSAATKYGYTTLTVTDPIAHTVVTTVISDGGN